MRRDLGSWAGNQAEVSKGAGTGQGHKQLLRSVQDAGPVWAECLKNDGWRFVTLYTRQ